MRALYIAPGLALLLLASLALPAAAAADPRQESPGRFIADVAQAAIHAANSKSISIGERQRIFEEILDTKFDIPQISVFVLGQYWHKASGEDRREFVEVFRNYVLRTYSNRFTGYDGESLRVLGQRAEGTDGTVVYTEIGAPGAKNLLKLEWRVVDRPEHRIVDLSVSGISMALTKREEFASYLRRNGEDLPGLTRQLEKMTTARSSR